MRKIRAAIIGSGLIAGKKHIPAFLKLRSKTELVAVCDLNLTAAKQVATRFGIPSAYGNIAEMLSTQKPELVDICEPPQTHVSLGRRGHAARLPRSGPRLKSWGTQDS